MFSRTDRSGATDVLSYHRDSVALQQPYLMGVRAAEAMFSHLSGKAPPKNVDRPELA
jgi:hypothetical protein